MNVTGREIADYVAAQHQGWAVWATRPTATRTGKPAVPRHDDGTWSMTVEARSWAELDELLTEQDEHDKVLAAQAAR
jgi:hypothetical protein